MKEWRLLILSIEGFFPVRFPGEWSLVEVSLHRQFEVEIVVFLSSQTNYPKSHCVFVSRPTRIYLINLRTYFISSSSKQSGAGHSIRWSSFKNIFSRLSLQIKRRIWYLEWVGEITPLFEIKTRHFKAKLTTSRVWYEVEVTH